MIECIDVSVYQRGVDLLCLPSTVRGVIIKAGGTLANGTMYEDAMFKTFYEMAKKKKLKIGAYFYSRADTIDKAKREADAFCRILKGKQFDLPVFCDYEEPNLLSARLCGRIVATFCERCRKNGFLCGLNTYDSAVRYFDPLFLKITPTWIAKYSSTKPDAKWDCDIWQNSGNGALKINKIEVDHDWIINDYSGYIKEVGLNGY